MAGQLGPHPVPLLSSLYGFATSQWSPLPPLIFVHTFVHTCVTQMEDVQWYDRAELAASVELYDTLGEESIAGVTSHFGCHKV